MKVMLKRLFPNFYDRIAAMDVLERLLLPVAVIILMACIYGLAGDVIFRMGWYDRALDNDATVWNDP